MRFSIKAIAALAVTGAIGLTQAQAQSVRVNVVTTCGAMSPFPALHAGTVGTLTVDGNGNICGGAAGSVGAPNVIGFSVGGTGTVVSASDPLPISGSFSATISGFAPASVGTPISVTTGGVTGSLPAGTVVVATNVGTTNGAYCALGGSSTTAQQYIAPNGGWFAYTVGAATQLTCITSTSTTTVNMVGGSGLATGTGGGGGSGGGGAVTIADGADVTLGAKADAKSTATDATPITLMQVAKEISALEQAPASRAVTNAGTFAVQSTLQTGSNTIGAVTGPAAAALATDAHLTSFTSANHTDLGTINTTLGSPFQAGAALGAGSNTIGSVDILGHAGATLDSAAGAGISQALAIQGVSGGVAVPVTGTLSASIGAFQPTPAYAQLTVGAASARVALPTGVDVMVYNTGSNPAYVLLGNSSVTATANDDVIPPNSWLEFAVGAAVDIAAIETTGATTLTISGGAGISAGSVGSPVTQPISIASGGVASGAFASGSIASGAAVSGAFVAGSIADLAHGQGAMAASVPVAIASDQSAVATKAASNTFVAGSIADLAHGQGTMAASVPVALASNQSSIPVTVASGGIASGAIASGALASGSIASGALAAGSISSGAAVSGAFATGAIADLALAQGSTSSGQKANMVLGAATTGAPTDTTGDSWPLSMTTAGGLRSDMSSVAGTTTLTGTGAVGAGSPRVAVGTDTATIAGSAPGSAGTASANVVTVQGIASMTALLANPGTIATWGLMSGTTSGTAPTNTQIVGAIYNSAAPTPSTGQTLPLQLDSAGNLDVNIKAGAGGGTASSFGSTFPSTGTAAGAEYLSSPPSLTTGQMVALQTTVAGSLHTTVDNTNANGSATSANSSPVVIASDQAAVAVKGTPDNTSFVANTTPTVDIGGLYQTTATTNPLSAGNSGMAQLTHYRALQTDWYNSSGTEMGTSGSPVQVSLANTASNGTAVLVTGTGGTFPAALNGTPSLANGNGVVPTQGGAVLSATNGEFANILQGNAVLASGNPLFAQLTTGSATIGALVANQSVNTAQVNGVTTLTGTGAVGTGAQRIAVGTDTATIAGSAPGTAGSASANVVTVQGIAAGTPVQTAPSAYPATAVPITASATGTTGATTATLTNVTAHTTYICGFSIRANATAAATGNATVTGTITGTLNFTQWTAPLASGLGVTEEVFTPCVPASAVSTSIAVVSAAPGTGGVVSVTAWGFSI